MKKILKIVLCFGIGIVCILIFLYFLGKSESPEKLSPGIIKMRVQGDSMEPTLKPGQEILVDTNWYKTHSLQRGDIVVVNFRLSNKKYVKRVVAIEGDKVEFKDGKIYINGSPLSEDYLKDPNWRFSEKNLKFLSLQLSRSNWQVPKNSFLGLSDNRIRTHDSRLWGLLSCDQIIGKVIIK